MCRRCSRTRRVAPPDAVAPPVASAPAPAQVSTAAKVAVAALLLVSVGGLGFMFGHYVVRPTTTITAAPRSNFPNVPSGGGFGGYSGNGGFGGYGGYGSSPSPATSAADAAAAKIAKVVDPGLVDITATFSYNGATAEGTGMVLTSKGLVLTNNHVVEGATSLTARDVATGATYKATVVGYDVSADVAVLKLTGASGLTTVTTGNSSTLASGESVVGIGNAGGVGGTPSYAAGTVVALDQSITASDEGNPAGAENLTGLIETSADIQPGDSGGPLVNAKGHVIGMDTAGSAANGGFGFQDSGSNGAQGYAIPIDTALAIVKSIKNGDATTAIHVGSTAFLGVEVAAGSAANATTSSGVTITQAIAGEPAASAGLTAGDVITSLDGQTVSSATDLQQVLLTLHAGDSVTVGYLSPAGTPSSVTLTLGSGPAQ